MAQLDAAFTQSRAAQSQSKAHAMASIRLSTNFQAGLWRDFTDPHRQRGEERF